MARQQAAAPQPPAPAAAPDALSAALARAVVRIAVSMPGGPATARQILTFQLKLSAEDADAIITAAEAS